MTVCGGMTSCLQPIALSFQCSFFCHPSVSYSDDTILFSGFQCQLLE
ncbi:MAG: hypothetical protein ACEY3L_03615 [Wolbachia sp.]